MRSPVALVLALLPLSLIASVLASRHARSSLHSAIKVQTDPEPRDAAVLVRQSEHEAGPLLGRRAAPTGPQTSIWLTEVDHVPGEGEVLMVCVGVAGQELGAGVPRVIVTHDAEVVHQPGARLVCGGHDSELDLASVGYIITYKYAYISVLSQYND